MFGNINIAIKGAASAFGAAPNISYVPLLLLDLHVQKTINISIGQTFVFILAYGMRYQASTAFTDSQIAAYSG